MSVIKRIKHFLKTYFYFSKTERQSVTALLLLIALVALAPWLYAKLFPPAAPVVEVVWLNQADSLLLQHNGYTHDVREYRYFDPNSATADDWKQFGISDKQLKSIRKFLQNGGVFKKPEDIEKLYALSSHQKKLILPYVDLPQQLSFADDTVRSTRKTVYPVNLNEADSLTILSLYRIGPGLTHRILEYRTKLGGFKSLEQLTEIWGFDEDILYDLKGKIYVDSTQAHIFNLNTVTADDLKTHPYFKYKLSNILINYRQQHGPYKTLQELRNTGVVNDSVYYRITRYLKIEK
ncbi:MAG: helix-hairpin-helix domain-containing protein [Bacteroidota bacterium]